LGWKSEKAERTTGEKKGKKLYLMEKRGTARKAGALSADIAPGKQEKMHGEKSLDTKREEKGSGLFRSERGESVSKGAVLH